MPGAARAPSCVKTTSRGQEGRPASRNGFEPSAKRNTRHYHRSGVERHLRGASFLDRVSKHRGTDSRNPGEDRLTEILAGVLERVSGLALSLAKGWTYPHREAAGEHAAATLATHDALRALPTSIVPRA